MADVIELWVPKIVSGDVAGCLAKTVRSFPLDVLRVYVDTNNGDATCWDLAEELLKHPMSTAIIGEEALSAGLIIARACAVRTCTPKTQFLFHGFKGLDEANSKKAAWFAKRTNLTEEEWYDLAKTGNDVEFGAEQALAWGIVQQVTT